MLYDRNSADIPAERQQETYEAYKKQAGKENEPGLEQRGDGGPPHFSPVVKEA
jgi:hypothetical protein